MASKGRPSKYKPDYCKLLATHMSQGLSFESFAAVVGVNRDTLYAWCRARAEFSDTKKRGEALSLLYWEKLGMAGIRGQIKGFNAASWIFNMKNRFGWRDKQPDEKAMDLPPRIGEPGHYEAMIGLVTRLEEKKARERTEDVGAAG